jgi:hypothetical protein
MSDQPEPKSIHTWFQATKPQIYAYDVDVNITLPQNLPEGCLVYPALQVNFEDHDDGATGACSGPRTVRR